MARKEIRVEELVEVIYQWHRGNRISQIRRSCGLDRKTIRKYVDLAKRHGFTQERELQSYTWYLELASRIQKGLKTPVDSSPTYRKNALYQCIIEKLLSKPYMKPKQVYCILQRNYNYALSYSSFNRYINIKYPKYPSIFIETKAREDSKIDSGFAGLMYDAEEGRLWVRKLLQGKISLNEIKQDLCSHIPYDDIEILYN